MSRVLVVDDDRDVQDSVGRVLQRAGHEVYFASDGMGAIRFIRADRPDLVVTDVLMPEMDGIELIMELRREAPELPIIAVSGGGRLPKELVLDTASALGAVHTVEKPFEIQHLLAVVDRALRG